MGVHGLWQLVQPVGRPVTLESLQGKRLAIDSSIWLYHFQMAMRDREGQTLTNAHLLGFLWRILKLLFYGIKPVFVFDGGAPVQKRRTIAQRKHRQTTAREAYAKTAEKLLAAQLRQAAMRSRTDAATATRTRTHTESLAPGTVYYGDVDAASASASASTSSAPPPKPVVAGRGAPRDPYHLPDLPADAMRATASKDLRFATESELRDLIRSIAPEDLDIHSELFRSLPPELQYELVGDLRLQSRGTSYQRLHAMLHAAPTAIDFSRAQVAALKTRNDLTQKVLTVTDELGSANIQVPMRVEGTRNREYVLTHIDSGDGGFALGAAGSSRDQPIVLDDEPLARHVGDANAAAAAAAADDDDDDDDLDMEEVDIGAPDPELDAIVQTESDPHARKERALAFLQARAEQHRRQKRHEAGVDAWEERMYGHVEPVQQGTDLFRDEPAHVETLYAVDGGHAQPVGEVWVGDQPRDARDAADADTDAPRGAPRRESPRAQLVDARPDAVPPDIQLQDDAEEKAHAPPPVERSAGLQLQDDAEEKAHAPPPVERSAGLQLQDDAEEKVHVPPPVERSAEGVRNHGAQRDTLRKDNSAAALKEERRARGLQPEDEARLAAPWASSAERADAQLDRPSHEHGATRPKGPLQREDRAETPPHSSPGAPAQPREDSAPHGTNEPSQGPLSLDSAAPEEHLQRRDMAESPRRDVRAAHADEQGAGSGARPPATHIPTAAADEREDARSSPRSPLFWSPSPSPEAVVGPDGFPLPADDIAADDEADDEAHIEGDQSEFADFLSATSGRSLPEMQRRVEAEVEALRTERARLRRPEEDTTHQMTMEIQAMLRLFGLPYVTAPMEAEAQCAQLATQRLVDGIITDDSDVFLFGGSPVYRNMFNTRRNVECYYASDMEKELGLSRTRLIQLAFLLGSDYTEGLPGVGPVMAMEILSLFSGEHALEAFRDWWRQVQVGEDDAPRSKVRARIKRALRSKVHLSSDWPDPREREAYVAPLVDDSDEPFVWGSADLDAIRAFLHEYLRWPAAKTDQYVLPLMEQQRKAARLQRMQATLDQAGFVGGRVPQPAQAAAFQSTRLQQVVQRFRQSQGAPDGAASADGADGADRADAARARPPPPPKRARRAHSHAST